MGIKEKVLMTVTIIILLIMVVMACYNLLNKKEMQKDKNIINEIELNKVNTTKEENQNEEEPENIPQENNTPTIQPKVTEEEINSNYVGEEEQKNTNTEQNQEEKVIELVKKEYGVEQGIIVNIANKDGNIYHVSISDVNTTQVLAWYKVDISTNVVTQE